MLSKIQGMAMAALAMMGNGDKCGEFLSRNGVRTRTNGKANGSAGYADAGAFGRCRGGARRSIRRAGQIAAGKFVRL